MFFVDPQTIAHIDTESAELPRQTPYLLTAIEERWVGNNPQRAKMLLVFVAHELVGVPLHLIGLAFAESNRGGKFGHDKGHVSRLVRQARMELRAALAADEAGRPAERRDAA